MVQRWRRSLSPGEAGERWSETCSNTGDDLLNIDRVPSGESYSPETPAPFLPAELTHFGQTLEALSGGERVLAQASSI
jgi:hypothetical protein